MSTSLQQQARSLRTNLEMLAVDPGYVEVEKGQARGFYEKWAEVNRACISAGYETADGDFSFVAKQLQLLFNKWPEDKTTIGILEVFPLSHQSAFLFGCYLNSLERVAKSS